jgi:PAS domain S-box-containing protein
MSNSEENNHRSGKSESLHRRIKEVLYNYEVNRRDLPVEVFYQLTRDLYTYVGELEKENEAIRQAGLQSKNLAEMPSTDLSDANEILQKEILERRRTEQVLRQEITERKQAEEALAQEGNLLRTLIDNLPDFIFVKDTGSRFVINNIAHVYALGATTQEEVIGKTDFDFFSPEMAKQYYNDEQTVITTGQSLIHREEPYLDNAGNLKWLSTTKVPLRDSHDQIIGLVGISRDVTAYKRADDLLRQAHDELEMRILERTAELVQANTVLQAEIIERKQVEEALRESEHRYKQLLDSVTDYIYTVHIENGHVLKTTHGPNCVAVTGYSSQEYEADPHLWYRMVYEEDRPGVREQALKLLSSESVAPLEHRIIHKDGSTRWVRNTPVLRKDHNQNIVSYDGLVSDITQRKLAEEERERLFEEVKAGRQRLEALSHRLVQVQEAERRQIARELHDEIGQLLTGLKLTLEMSVGLLGEPLKVNLDEAQSLINELISQVRELSLELRPAMLDDLGLIPTLLWHFERYSAQTQIQVDLEHTGLNKRFASEVETTAYRIIQEALTNVARHAGVNEATVRLRVDQKMMHVEIKDDGAGFDPADKQAGVDSSGLSGMYERAALLGGQFTIESSPETGTRVAANLPLEISAAKLDDR